jgi:hypothetical protein
MGSLSGVLTPLYIPGGTGLPPDGITGLVGWWEADAITGLSDNDPVTTWLDQSSALADVSQSSATFKPIYKTAIVNGLPVVRFDGIDDWLYGAPFASPLAQPTTVVAVARTSHAAAANEQVFSGLTGTNRHVLYITGSAWNIYAQTGGSGTTIAGNAAVDNQWYVVIGVFNGGTSLIEVSGAAPITGSVGTNPLDGPLIGNDPGHGTPWEGDIAGVALYNHALDATERTNSRGWWGAKYGIAV